ncbi:hypothetical protein CERZMDRAFT_92756 [Cercospora zeae-maydis SCOH1-5]|uniref:Uncharacterized protein n=1 Tax=Cercospora zeae-maydis SCOH1-5 TaxID=717836 RepID=A0A6A6FTC8_9PEZI|nr:hypothetical protein CERZMDRAFT_92756 [Cercospora zeae-maydis SCOH1-5]
MVNTLLAKHSASWRFDAGGGPATHLSDSLHGDESARGGKKQKPETRDIESALLRVMFTNTKPLVHHRKRQEGCVTRPLVPGEASDGKKLSLTTTPASNPNAFSVTASAASGLPTSHRAVISGFQPQVEAHVQPPQSCLGLRGHDWDVVHASMLPAAIELSRPYMASTSHPLINVDSLSTKNRAHEDRMESQGYTRSFDDHKRRIVPPTNLASIICS